MDRFLKYTTQKEPAITASFIGALLLALVARYFNLTEEDLTILGPIALIIGGIVIRQGVFSPASVQKLLSPDKEPDTGPPPNG